MPGVNTDISKEPGGSHRDRRSSATYSPRWWPQGTDDLPPRRAPKLGAPHCEVIGVDKRISVLSVKPLHGHECVRVRACVNVFGGGLAPSSAAQSAGSWTTARTSACPLAGQ